MELTLSVKQSSVRDMVKAQETSRFIQNPRDKTKSAPKSSRPARPGLLKRHHVPNTGLLLSVVDFVCLFVLSIISRLEI
jgi:hypothetical protein